MLEVLLHGKKVGSLRVKDNGNLQFRYADAYLNSTGAIPLSQNLPLEQEAFPHRACLAFFANLLPEEGSRDRVAEILGISTDNAYAMLERIGGDCAGAVVLIPENEATPTPEAHVHELDETALHELVVSLEERPLAVKGEGVTRMSLAGAQPKAPVIYGASRFALPVGGEPPTTHIVKPAPSRFPGLVDNEFFCMKLARAVGLPVADVERRTTREGTSYLLVARYDRDLSHEPIRRLHQEDLCQALGRLPHEKYQQEGGPTAREAMDLLNAASAVPAVDRPTFWSAMIFNFLIGNCDAHGKNFSLLYDSRSPHLAPLYDLVSTAMYPDLSRRLSMSIDGAQMLEEVDRGAWEKLAEEAGLSRLYAMREFDRLVGRVLGEARRLVEDYEHDSATAREIAAGIEQRAAVVTR